MDEGVARLYAATRAVADLMTQHPQIIGLDFADVRSILDLSCSIRERFGGDRAVCGHGIAGGPDRAVRATEAALEDLRDQIRELRGQASDPMV